MKFINRGEGVRRLGDHKKYANALSRNYASTIWQFNDDARKQRLLVCEFHTKANALNGDAMKVLEEAVERLEKDDYQGLVVYNEAMNFSAGADLNTMIGLADNEDWTGIDKYLSHFQSVCQKMRYASKPTVSAVAGLAIGGGFEVACQTSRMVAHMNSTLGLVETGVGLVPGGGGCKELLWRWTSDLDFEGKSDEAALKVFDIIGYGLMAHSPLQAKKHKFFIEGDVMVLNRDHLLVEAFKQVHELKRDTLLQSNRLSVKRGGDQRENASGSFRFREKKHYFWLRCGHWSAFSNGPKWRRYRSFKDFKRKRSV